MGRYGSRLLLLMVVWMVASWGAAEPTTGTLKVLVSSVPPFVEGTPGASGMEFSGFSIDYWESIADEIGMKFDYEMVPFPQLLERVRAGEADVGVGAISMTLDREISGLDYSYPYFNSGLGIMVLSPEEESLANHIADAFLNKQTLSILAFLLIYVLITAHVIWLCEKGRAAFSDKYFPGVPEGVWWTIVTMSTVGYGDKVPEKWLGKVCAVLTIFVGIGVFGWALSQLTAVSIYEREMEIRSLRDLSGRVVAVKSGTTSGALVRNIGATAMELSDLDVAYEYLADGKVTAVVHDWPVLRYHVLSSGGGKVELVDGMFALQDYAFLLPEGSPLKDKINRAHLKLRETGVHEHLYKRYFGEQ